MIASDILEPGETLRSCGGDYQLAHQGDGNLVLYQRSTGRAIWNTATYGHATSRLAMQGDGNLVLYATDGRALWHTRTGGYRNAYLAVQDDGNLVLYWGTTPLWHIR